MGFDMVVALPGTTPDGQMLFGHNGSRPAEEGQSLDRQPPRAHACGETLIFGPLALAQVRQTHAVVGWQATGRWGYRHGVNEHRVVVGRNPIRARLHSDGSGLTGPDLVRLALERATSARQARDVILDLVGRHGQMAAESEEPNSTFLVADVREAFVLETAGNHWAEQEVHAVRAVSDVCHLHQDWDRISRGLADVAIGRGWWPQDGSKLDFAKIAAPGDREAPPAMRRWGRATLLLEQHSGRVDRAFVRRLLADHFEMPAARSADAFAHPLAEQSICRHGDDPVAPATAVSLIAELTPLMDQLPLAWCAFGPPCTSVYFPIPLAGELPHALQADGGDTGCAVWRSMSRLLHQCRLDARRWEQVREEMARLQLRFEDNCRDLIADAVQLRHAGRQTELERLAESFMQHNVECFEEVCQNLSPIGERHADKRPAVTQPEPRVAEEEMLPVF
jgi:secernin